MNFRIFPLVVIVTSLLACKGDNEPQISEGEKLAQEIAGKKGGSKTWVLKSFKFRGNEIYEGVCEYDNEYTFYNNSSRSFEGYEGDEICLYWVDMDEDGLEEPNELINYGEFIESGYWNISEDGKRVLISTINTQSAFAIFSFVTPFGYPFPAEIWKLTESEFQLRMYANVGIEEYDIAISFEVKN